MDLTELKDFLIAAQLPHALGTSNAERLPDGSVKITFAEGDWSFEDTFYGGEPYGGREIIHFQGKPVWIMVYYGRVHDTDLAIDRVYNFLRTALQHPPEDNPYRGPDVFKHDQMEYRNTVNGTFESYHGREIILQDGKEIYWAEYLGGLVDQQADVGF